MARKQSSSVRKAPVTTPKWRLVACTFIRPGANRSTLLPVLSPHEWRLQTVVETRRSQQRAFALAQAHHANIQHLCQLFTLRRPNVASERDGVETVNASQASCTSSTADGPTARWQWSSQSLTRHVKTPLLRPTSAESVLVPVLSQHEAGRENRSLWVSRRQDADWAVSRESPPPAVRLVTKLGTIYQQAPSRGDGFTSQILRIMPLVFPASTLCSVAFAPVSEGATLRRVYAVRELDAASRLTQENSKNLLREHM